MEEYIVQYGDTLENIAAKKFGNKNRWREIAQLNNLQNTNELLVGQRLRFPNSGSSLINSVPNQPLNTSSNTLNQQIPATIVPARGFTFVVFEQLPEIGSKNVLRKVQIIPTDFSLQPKNPLAAFTPAEHALKGNILDTQLLSASDKPFGSPTMGKYSPLGNPQGYKEVLLIDTQQAMAQGSRVYTVPEVVADLRRYAALEPNNQGLQQQIKKIIRVIENVEGEVLIEGGVPGNAVKKVSSAHTPYIETADEIWAARTAGKITLEEAEGRLAVLAKAYERAKIVGRVGRVLTVVGVVLTAVDLGVAGKKSYDKNSFRPLAAETVRQAGGWSGVYAGAIAGAGLGALFGIETGPGAILFAAGGAMIFGAIGYWRGNVIAGWIDPPDQVTNELRKDVNFAEGLKYRDINLTVGANENQYDFRRRALIAAAVEVQRETFRMVDSRLPNRFADKFAPLRSSNITKDYALNWIKDADGKNPESDKDKDGTINIKEWKKEQGKSFTYRLDVREADELIKMVFGLTR